jgi:cell division protein FtsI (penicillin-binding protein 3)
MAPADKPELVVAVSLVNPRNGHYGGAEAGPVFKSVMTFALQAMRVPPTGTKPPTMRLTW